MKKLILLGFLCFLYILNLHAQETFNITGRIVDTNSEKPISEVTISILETSFLISTNNDGTFVFKNLKSGNYSVRISKNGYQTQTFSISLAENLNLSTIYLEFESFNLEETGIISLNSDDLLDDNNSNSTYVSGLFQSSKDIFLRTAAFSFSQTWFKVRGYDSNNSTISLNGVEMNKFYDGRPQWSNWGGLNDALRNQDFSSGIAPSEISFGGILGSTNFNTRASDNQKGGKVSYAFANKSYTGRLMATYSTGLNKNNWAFTVSGSKRYGNEGMIQGTFYNSWSGLITAEKKLNKNHSLNLTAISAYNKRGKSSPLTQEVYDLKGQDYNPYWGFQEGEVRNSRTKEIFEPILMLSHFYNSTKSTLKTSISYQTGFINNSRLGYFNAPNPDPTYWKYLPSNYLRYVDNLNYEGAYLATENIVNNGQLNWRNLYETNSLNIESLYYLYNDKVEDSQLSFNSNLTTNFTDKIQLNAGVSFRNLTSKNYAEMDDLLGGTGFTDLDQYAVGEARQNDLNNPNNVVLKGDKFQYNYNINGFTAGSFAQVQITQNKVDYFIGLNVKNSSFQREGLYKNGTYASNSYGKGEKQTFTNLSAKGGVTYKISGRHLVSLNTAYVSKSPTIKAIFSNSRVNNLITPNLTSESIVTGDLNYIFRSPKLQGRLTGYYTKFRDAIETGFYFAEGLRGSQADFVSEVLTGVEKKHIGIELGIEYALTPAVKFLGAAAVGEFTYDNNPNLYLNSESFINAESDFGIAYLKNYKLSGTSQNAYSLGFEYRDPAYYWFQINGNFLSNNYIDVSPLLRTKNFIVDADGVPFIDDETGVEITQEQVNLLLKQEKFDSVLLMNLVAGKSWKIKDYYFGIFAGINNVLGETYKTGGFEQARNANYPELKQDKELDNPIFSPKYWYNKGTSYYINFYVRF